MLNVENFFVSSLPNFFWLVAAFALLCAAFLHQSIQRGIRQKNEIADLKKRVFEINAELEKTNDELRTFDQGKIEFVSIVSHQLRAPITSIKGHSSMLLDGSYGKLPAPLRKPLEKIFISSEHLAQIVTDFLDLSKVEQGTMSYVFGPVDLKAILADLAQEFTPLAEKKGLRLDCKLPAKKSFIVWADKTKVRQILSNLIDNSIKYTPRGKLHISLTKNEEQKIVAVHLVDTGIGLAHEDIYHIFGRFTRGKQGRQENTEGSGLGLYVAKKMLEAQRGRIWADSAGVGKGSTFVIELPLEQGS